MRTIIKLFLLLLIPVFSNAQTNPANSLKQLLKTETSDTSRANLLLKLAFTYYSSKPDTTLLLAQQALSLSKKTGFTKGEAGSLNTIGNVLMTTGNYPKALEILLQALKKFEAMQNKEGMAKVLLDIGDVYSTQGDYRKSINYIFKALAIANSINSQRAVLVGTGNLGDSYEKLNMLDSAKYYTNTAYNLAMRLKDNDLIGVVLNNLGNIYSKMGNDTVAMRNYKSANPYYTGEGDDNGLCETYLGMAKLFQKAGDADSCLYYAKLSFSIAQKDGFTNFVMDASKFLNGYYASVHNIDSAYIYQTAMIAAKDSLFSEEKQRQFQNLSLAEMQRQQDIQDAKEEARTQMKFYILFGGLF